MTMITPSYLGETIEYSSLHACRSTLEDPTEYPFEIGHFLWMWDFPLRDMDQSKSTIYVNDEESTHFINHPLQDGHHYKAVFTSKAYDESKDTDFLPEN